MKKVKNLKDLDDLNKILSEYKNLIIQVFQIGYIREIVKDYRHKRAEKFQSYNVFNTTTHVGLENFYILLLWKLFDEKKSRMSVYGICDTIEDPRFKNFFNDEIEKIKEEIDILNNWRSRVICHRDITVHFNPKLLENNFPLNDERVEKLKNFLLEFLCQLDFSLHRYKIEDLRDNYQNVLNDLKKFCYDETEKILKDFSI
ncbi:hypothetical protein KKA66_00850 [Patescibacteria group bacterium]|nr:hypothetical protein [Patescibacteria group bacterium]